MNGFASIKQNTKYAYAVGRIRALETRLLDRTAMGRLLEAESAQELLKMLSEGEYEQALSSIDKAEDFETALNIERERIYTLIDELTLDPQLTQIFRVRWDFHNLKVLLKSSFLRAADSTVLSRTDDALIESGLIYIEALKSTVEPEDDQAGIGSALTSPIWKTNGNGDYITDALEHARIQYEESQNPQMIDIVIDNHLQSFL